MTMITFTERFGNYVTLKRSEIVGHKFNCRGVLDFHVILSSGALVRVDIEPEDYFKTIEEFDSRETAGKGRT